MAEPVDVLYASNGDGPAVRATVSAQRLPTDMDLITDSVLNWPHKGIATSGTPDEDGVIIPDTECVFTYVLSGTIIHITGFAPGYYDIGHEENQIVILKPTTYHTDTVAELLAGGGLPEGGTTGQALVKASDATGDVEWSDAGGSATAVIDEALGGTINGTNKVFTTAFDINRITVFYNGVAQHAGDDFTVTGTKQITFTTAPVTGSRVTANYYTSEATGETVLGANSITYKEIASGAVNGTNTSFMTLNPYVAGTLEVYVNGVNQGPMATETNPATGAFTVDAPSTGSQVFVTYQRSLGVTGNADTVDGFNANATPTANTIPVLDSNGRMPGSTVAVECAFRLVPNGAISLTNTDTYVNLQSLQYNIGGGYDLSTNTFTAPYKGIYTFMFLAFTENTATNRAFVWVRISTSSSSIQYRGVDIQGTQVYRAMVVWEGLLEAGDTARFGGYSATTASINYSPTFATGRLVGRVN